ncbi:DUF4276 family protein [Hymenobacter sp. NST-14]|uniref:DUF4276 family protein n=1 Tax=Hymenobacter piscis TaxID=2839984 RepID=UPI001C01B794|nr:DUF4276 family protein [Hymenobacter piscis]MBT9393264.1 DUF4276 family protein [Hymenobacter piscis]
MRVEFLLEEESAEAALKILVPKLLPAQYVARFRVFEGCADLLHQLPDLLRGYRRRISQPGQQDLRIVVLLDADGIAARRLAEMEASAATAGLLSYAQAPAGQVFYVLNALAVQELEAWFLGDRQAIQTAYPRVHAHHFSGLPADPDTIPDAWETLLRVLQKADARATKGKVKWAESIAPHLDIPANKSPSFLAFCQGLTQL